MPLAKEIEFPLFHLGTYTSQEGTKVTLDEDKLRRMARNTDFILKSKVLQAPVKRVDRVGYDHPVYGADKENHGQLVGAEYRNGTVFVRGTNWSDRLVADTKSLARIAYSGEFAENLSYPAADGTGKMIDLGPAIVGIGILGGDRPSVKNLKPLSEFAFGEGTHPVDEFETREELRKSGLVAEYVEGTHFFGEVENDARRFFSEEQEPTMTDAEIQAAIKSAVTAATQPLLDANAALTKKVESFSERSVIVTKVNSFCEKLRADKKNLGQIPMKNLEELLLHPEMTDAVREKAERFAESLSGVLIPSGRSDAGGDAGAGGGAGDNEPKALADLRPKHFKDPRNHETEIAAGVQAFSEFKPDEVKGLEAKPDLLIEKTKRYIMERDGAAN